MYLVDAPKKSPGPKKRKAKSRHASRSLSRQESQDGPAPSITTLQETDSHSSHIVGPASARDAQELEQYASLILKNEVKVPQIRPNPYNVYSKDLNKPVLYYSVGKMHGNLKRRLTSGINECEILERLLEPFAEELVDLYGPRSVKLPQHAQ